MKKLIIFLIILIILGGAGFSIYWFVFRDRSDGGNLTNKEVLFALQNVLEDQGVNLNDVVEDYKKVDFAPASSLVVYADGTQKLEDKFENLLTLNSAFEYDNANFEKFSSVLQLSYKAIYNNVFNGKKFRQNVWYEFENSKIKVYSDSDEIINIKAFNNSIYFDIDIQYNFRNENNVYSYETKILKDEDIKTYEYLYFNRNSKDVLSFDDIEFSSQEKYIGNEEEINLINSKIEMSKLNGTEYLAIKEISDQQKSEILNYTLKELKVNFKNFDNIKNAKSEKLN